MNTSTQDITLALQQLGFEVNGVKKMRAKWPSHEGLAVTAYEPSPLPEVTNNLHIYQHLPSMSKPVESRLALGSATTATFWPHLGSLQKTPESSLMQEWPSSPRVLEEKQQSQQNYLLYLRGAASQRLASNRSSNGESSILGARYPLAAALHPNYPTQGTRPLLRRRRQRQQQ
jgi:hypothetical protein